MLKAALTLVNVAIISTFAYLYGVAQAQPEIDLQSRIDCVVAQAIAEQYQ
jgi:hypothetical protein